MSTSPLSPEEIRVAAEVHRELGPQYSDSVVQSFLEKIDAEVQDRIDAHLAASPLPGSRPAALAKPASGRRRAFLAGTAAGLAGAGLPLTFMALQLARSGGQTGHGLLVAWIVIGVIFIAMVAGLTGTVTIAISSPARRRRAGPAR